jgi:hypothetical protein
MTANIFHVGRGRKLRTQASNTQVTTASISVSTPCEIRKQLMASQDESCPALYKKK